MSNIQTSNSNVKKGFIILILCVYGLFLSNRSFNKIQNDKIMTTNVKAIILDNTSCKQHIIKTNFIEKMSHCICDGTISHTYIFNNTVQTFSKVIDVQFSLVPMNGDYKVVSLYYKNRIPQMFHVHYYQRDFIDDQNLNFCGALGMIEGMLIGGIAGSFMLMLDDVKKNKKL